MVLLKHLQQPRKAYSTHYKEPYDWHTDNPSCCARNDQRVDSKKSQTLEIFKM